jgi:VanZ family protein
MNAWRFIAACGGWALLVYIGFVTLSPIQQRPHVGGVLFERAAAFGLMGFLLAIAYQQYIARLLVFVVGVAVVLELSQLLVPGRHAEIPDAIEKIAGGALGVGAAMLITKAAQMWSNSR